MANQDGNMSVWAIWDLNGGAGTYATHTFAGGALMVGQSVSIDWTHNVNINDGTSIGIRLLDGSNNEVAFVFQGGKLVFSRYDTATGVYVDTAKYYDRYDFYQVVFTRTGANSYAMSVTEGSIADNPTGMGNNADDNNPAAGNVVDSWTGSFTGTAITGIQVYTEGGNSSDQWFDNLTISSDGMKNPHDPVPANGATEVSEANIVLTWQAGTDPNGNPLPGLKGYYVYFGEEADTLYQENTTLLPTATTTYNIGSKATDKTYYWQVEEAMDNGLGGSYAAGDPNNVMGSIWSFTTIISIPVISTQPQPALAAIGDSAEFTIGVTSITTPTFTWYYSTDPNNNTPVDDILRSTDQTFNIPTVGSSDEGYYYCIVNNDSGIAVASSTVRLEIKKLIAWYALEGDVTDSENDYDGTVIETDPNLPPSYVTGEVGQAISLYGVGDAVSIPRSIQDSFTIELWVKTAATGGTGGWYNGLGLVDGRCQ
jgi:hypothetical protein